MGLRRVGSPHLVLLSTYCIASCGFWSRSSSAECIRGGSNKFYMAEWDVDSLSNQNRQNVKSSEAVLLFNNL